MEFLEQQARAQYRLFKHEGFYTQLHCQDTLTKTLVGRDLVYGEDQVIEWASRFNTKGSLYIGRALRTKDGNIAGLGCATLDIDPIRNVGQASTEDQHASVLQQALKIRNQEGNGVLGSSGNGALLIFPFERVEVSDLQQLQEQCRQFEVEIRKTFQTEEVRIDATFDLARMARIMGSFNPKCGRVAKFIDPIHFVLSAGTSSILKRIRAIAAPSNPMGMGADYGLRQPGSLVLDSDSEGGRLGPADRLRLAEESLDRIAQSRCDNYDEWLKCGIALKEFGPAGFQLWNKWSSKSSRYAPGACQEKWISFRSDQLLTVGTLKYWADVDDPTGAKKSQPLLLGQPVRRMLEPSNGGELLTIREAGDIFSGEVRTRVEGYGTGFRWLNSHISGYVPGNLYVIQAITSAGKTVFAVQAAYNLCRAGKRVLLVTTEMSTDEIRDRFIAVGTGISASAIAAGRTNGNTGRVDAFVREAAGFAFSVRESASPRIEELAKAVVQTKAEVLIFDYFQHVDTGTTTRATELATLARGLEGLSKTYQVPVIVTAQLHEFFDFKTHKRLPSKKNDVKDCKAINDAASCVLVIDWLNQEVGDGPVPVRWSIEKNRHGSRGETIMKLNRSVPRFEP